MNVRRAQVFHPWLLMASALVWATAAAQTQQQTSLSMSLRVEKSSFVVGEPTYVSLHLRNGGDGSVRVPEILELQSGTIRVDITDPTGETTAFAPLFYADMTLPERELRPGGAQASVLAVFFGSADWSFAEPGSYELTARTAGRVGEVPPLTSNTVTIDVTSEAGVSALLVDESDASREAGKLLLWQQGDHLEEGMVRLTDLIDRFPGSTLADYARLALASNLSRAFRDYTRGRVRPADCPEALRLFDQIQEDRLPTYLRIKLARDRARCLDEVGQARAAGTARQRAESLAADREEFRILFR